MGNNRLHNTGSRHRIFILRSSLCRMSGAYDLCQTLVTQSSLYRPLKHCYRLDSFNLMGKDIFFILSCLCTLDLYLQHIMQMCSFTTRTMLPRVKDGRFAPFSADYHHFCSIPHYETYKICGPDPSVQQLSPYFWIDSKQEEHMLIKLELHHLKMMQEATRSFFCFLIFKNARECTSCNIFKD